MSAPFVFTCPTCAQPIHPEGLGWRMDHARDCTNKTRTPPNPREDQRAMNPNDKIIIEEHARINAPDAEPGPWPREGETWAPVFPWPASGCPIGLYIHGYSEALIGGEAGWMLGIIGATFLNPGLPPMSTETATAMAWEFRYGSADIKERHSTLSFAPGSGMRAGPEPIVVDAVGAGNVYGHYLDGRPVRLPALDLRRGWGRIGAQLLLPWYLRDQERAACRLPPDGLWNGPTPCGSTIAGVAEADRALYERLHFETCKHGCAKVAT